MATVNRSKFGINAGAGNEPGFDYPRLVGALADTGVAWAYVPVFWSWLEPTGAGTTYYGPLLSKTGS